MSTPLSPLRKDRVTASRLPPLLGISPYTTRQALLRQMVREHFDDPSEFTGNAATMWGNLQEAEIIAAYELTRGVQVFLTGAEQQTFVHPTMTYLAATPDGVTNDRVIECKAPWRALYTSIHERPDYAAQMQLQMEVLDLPAADLVIFRPRQPLLVDTLYRDRDWMESVLPAIDDFLREYWEVIDTPELCVPHREPLKDIRQDTEWTLAAREWLELDHLVKQLTEAKDAAAARLAELSPDKPARGSGVDLLRFQRKGNVQYKKVLEDFKVDVDLDKYRGRPAEVITVRRVGAQQREQG